MAPRDVAPNPVAMICARKLTLALLSGAMISPFALAAASPAAEEIVVTGSRLKRAAAQAGPRSVIARADIETRAFDILADAVNELPMAGVGANRNGTNLLPSSLGVSFADLLDLGAQRTLTLVDGRRVVSGNAGSLFVYGNEAGGQVDLSIIPAIMVERVDVVAASGGPVYGADAVAGVVNIVLRDDVEGLETDYALGVADRGDARTAAAAALYGATFDEGRGHVMASLEYRFVAGLQADARDFHRAAPGVVTNARNGALRNPAFDPAAGPIDVAGLNNGAFLRAVDDGVPGALLAWGARGFQVSHGGMVFTTAYPFPVNQVGPAGLAFVNGAAQFIPGGPVTDPAGANALPFATWAPRSLPAGVAPEDAFSAFGVAPPAGLTAAEASALALNVLQANRMTPREYFERHPDTPLDLFLGSFVAGLPTIPNPDPETAPWFPRVAVPLRFDADGRVERFSFADLGADASGTLAAAPGGDGYDLAPYTTLRAGQTRWMGDLALRYELGEVELFAHAAYARVASIAPATTASANSSALATTENAGLIVNVDNPFLTDEDRAVLAGAGVTGNFVLSRTNQDIQGRNPLRAETDTLRLVAGLGGEADIFLRRFDWEASLSWGASDLTSSQTQIGDLEYALAVDAARAPDGRIVCRAQTLAAPPASVPGVQGNIVRMPGPDGVMTETFYTPRPTPEMIAACEPLNVFGYDRMSEAAKDYVLARSVLVNRNTLFVAQGEIGGEIAALPAGPLAISLSGEYRRTGLSFAANEVNSLGRTRLAPSAATIASAATLEAGVELAVPVLGGDMPRWLGRLTLTPAIRWMRQSGEAEEYRDIAGRLVTPRHEGDDEFAWSLAGAWSFYDVATLRGGVARAIRQPSLTELFLGGQPAFTVAQDPCGVTQIAQGPSPDRRRANCVADVIARGLASDEVSAGAFLNDYRPVMAPFQAAISGAQDLHPEIAESWTVGLVLAPSLRAAEIAFAVDYIHLDLADMLGPMQAQNALRYCYDGAAFPPAGGVAAAACAGVRRDAAFNLANGFALPYFNLPGARLRAWSASLDVSLDLDGLVDLPVAPGDLVLRAEAFHLAEFAESASGAFVDDAMRTDGSVNARRPEWRSRLSAVWTRGDVFLGWTWSWTSAQRVWAGGGPASVETQDRLVYPAYSLHDAALGWRVGEGATIQLNIANVFDEIAPDLLLAGQQYFADSVGRRYTLSVRAAF